MNDDVDDQLDGPILDPADDAAVTALLAGLPEVAIPDDVAERLAAALAAEVPLSGAVPPWAAGGATNVSVLPSQRERDQHKANRRARVLSAAAGLVLVLGAVAFGTQFFQSDNDSGTTAGAGGATAEGSNGGGQASAEATLLTSSDTAYTQADLAPKVTGLVSAASLPNAPKTVWPDSDSSSPPPTPAPTLSDVRAFTRQPLDALAVCVAKLGATAHPVAVDTGTWSSARLTAEPVAVIVLPGSDPARVDVFVVTAGCGDPAVVDDSYLVYFASVERP